MLLLSLYVYVSVVFSSTHNKNHNGITHHIILNRLTVVIYLKNEIITLFKSYSWESYFSFVTETIK